ncbi:MULTISPECIES: lipopolysaccharide biosynthesis protein [Butyrivibrio]|uniref:lipopolysaccharide biosynthesis protein n=1 Tax=Butyrivibrio TaxID=830 RepID=UPI00040B01AF|nr:MULTISPECIES: oligosaccharide flippase family protein [Butyrivibrio]SEQ25409.1 Membrane protein involved in the export of O-antigen and teichoic acid [Butyrivibrio sp. TB]
MSNKFAKDLSCVVIGNVFVLISSILTGLVVPKIMGVTNYGYYQIYTLYLTYVALLHFGFVDGVLLRHAGEKFDELDKLLFRSNTRSFALLELFLSSVFIIFSFIIFKGIYRFIGISLGIETFTTNMTSYYQYISQSTMRFKEWSSRKIIQSSLKIIVTCVLASLYFTGNISYISAELYLLCILIIDIALLIWYMWTYSDITFGTCYKFDSTRIFVYFKAGITLTLAYEIANLVFSLDRQFVSILFNADEYGIYAFAYRLLSMVTTVINAVSVVLFPNLKRKSKVAGERIMYSMSDNIAMIAISVFAAHIGYYPLMIFIKKLLPEYINSLMYLRIIFPSIAITCCISVIIFNYYKVLNKNHIYCFISLIILGLSAFLNVIAYYIWRIPEAISGASIVTLFIWYLALQYIFIKEYKIKWKRNFIYILLITGLFYFSNFAFNSGLCAALFYSVLYISITIVFYKKLLKNNLGKLYRE